MNDYAATLRALRTIAIQELDRLHQQPQPVAPIIAVVEERVVELTELIEQEERR